MFWASLGQSLHKHFQDSSRGKIPAKASVDMEFDWRSGSSFLQQTLVGGYPRLLRIFHDFFGKIGVHTDTVYTDAYQR